MDTEKKIMKAAQSTFLKKGYSATSMIEIANLVGINKAMIHYYFRNKRNLYIHSVSRIINDEIRPLFKVIVADTNIDDKRRLMDSLGQLIVKRYPWLVMILIDQEDPMHSEIVSILNKNMESYSENLNQDRGQNNSLNLTQKAMVLFAYSIIPRLFETLFKSLFHVKNSEYEYITTDFYRRITKVIEIEY